MQKSQKSIVRIAVVGAILILVLSIALTVNAGVFKTSIFKDQTTENSIVHLKGAVDKDIKTLWFRVTKGQNKCDYYVRPNGGELEADLILPFGAGNYEVEVDAKKEEKYVVYKTMKVTNTDISLNLSNRTVNNSIALVDAIQEKGVKAVELRVRIGNKRDLMTVKTKDGRLEKPIYLRFGPGEYKITVLKSSQEGKKYSGDIGTAEFTVMNTDKKENKYLFPAFYVDSDHPKIIALAKEITKDCKTDFERMRAIHDWVAKNIAYDIEAVINDDVKGYKASETLETKKGVCQDYSLLVAALHRAIGMQARLIYGMAVIPNDKSGVDLKAFVGMQHAWNEIWIDGKWVPEDVTWDAGDIDPKTQKFFFKLSHRYFNMSIKEFNLEHRMIEIQDDITTNL